MGLSDLRAPDGTAATDLHPRLAVIVVAEADRRALVGAANAALGPSALVVGRGDLERIAGLREGAGGQTPDATGTVATPAVDTGPARRALANVEARLATLIECTVTYEAANGASVAARARAKAANEALVAALDQQRIARTTWRQTEARLREVDLLALDEAGLRRGLEAALARLHQSEGTYGPGTHDPGTHDPGINSPGRHDAGVQSPDARNPVASHDDRNGEAHSPGLDGLDLRDPKGHEPKADGAQAPGGDLVGSSDKLRSSDDLAGSSDDLGSSDNLGSINAAGNDNPTSSGGPPVEDPSDAAALVESYHAELEARANGRGAPPLPFPTASSLRSQTAVVRLVVADAVARAKTDVADADAAATAAGSERLIAAGAMHAAYRELSTCVISRAWDGDAAHLQRAVERSVDGLRAFIDRARPEPHPSAIVAGLRALCGVQRHDPGPIVLDDPLPAAEQPSDVLDLLIELSSFGQVLYLTDDAFIAGWARSESPDLAGVTSPRSPVAHR